MKGGAAAGSPARMAEHKGSSSLFGIFVLAIYSLLLIPYTFFYICSPSEEQPQAFVEKKKKKQSPLAKAAKRLLTKGARSRGRGRETGGGSGAP